MIKLSAILMVPLISAACTAVPMVLTPTPYTASSTPFSITGTALSATSVPVSTEISTGVSATHNTAPTLLAITSPATLAEPSTMNWRVQMELSGGIAGYQRSLMLSSDGLLTVVDLKLGREVTVRVPQTNLQQIASYIAKVRPLQPKKSSRSCADCFHYALDIERSGEHISIQMDDSSLAESGLGPLTGALADLIDQALSGRLKP